jgi:hypothetical protein
MIPRAFPSSARRATSRVLTPARRPYATEPGYSERRDKTLKTSSRLTWRVLSTHLPLPLLIYPRTLVPAASIAGLLYQYYDFTSTSSWPAPNGHNTQHEKQRGLEAPKPVEDRHGDTVAKHAIAAHKNQNKVREGAFKGGEFDNHVQKHSGDPSKDFEKK